jgi:flagellar hook-associated protein 2
MSSAGISFGGLGSGLDTRSIISALMAVERRPISALNAKKSSLNTSKNLFGDFKKLLTDLDTKAKALRTTTDFLEMKASSSNEDVLTVRAGSTATPGSYQIKVMALASSQVSVSNGRAAKDDPVFGDGTFFLNVNGTDHPIDIGAGTNYASTLDGIAQAIRDKGLDVTAEVVDTGQSGAQRYQLALRSTVVGSEGAFSLSLDSGNASLSTLVNEVNANVRAPGQDAHLLYNGVDVYRSSNSVGDLIPGVTLDLKATDLVNPVTVTITTDAEETSKKVKEFVDTYNKVVDFIGTQNQLGEDGAAKNPLFGDGTLRSIRSSLRTIVGSSVDTGNTAISMLAIAGIASDREGKLTFNQSKFEEKLGEDEQAVASLFSATNVGIASRLTSQIEAYTSSVDGLIKTRQDGFDRMIKDAQRRIDQGEARLVRFEQNLEQRFANLETQIARLQGQGSALQGFPAARR